MNRTLTEPSRPDCGAPLTTYHVCKPKGGPR